MAAPVTIADIKAKLMDPNYNKRFSSTGQKLSGVTVASYLSNFRVVSTILKERNFQAIAEMDTTDVLAAIKQAALDKKPVTLRGYLSAMANLFRYQLVAPDPVRKELYLAAEMQVARKVNNIQESNTTHDRITSAGKTWKDIVTLREQEKARDDGGPFHLLLAMYTLIPPRRVAEYAVTEVYFEDAPADAASRNYVLLKRGDKASTMHINLYKTARSLGPYTARLPEELVRVIRKNLTRFARPTSPPHLIVDEEGNAMPSATHMSSYIRRQFTRRLGSPLLVTDLRHLFITDYLSKQHKVADRKKVGRAMGHDILSQMKYLNISEKHFTAAERAAAQEDPVAARGDEEDEVDAVADNAAPVPVPAPDDAVVEADGAPPPAAPLSPRSRRRQRRLEALDAFILDVVQKAANLVQMYLREAEHDEDE